MQQMTKSEFLAALADALYAYSDLTDEMVERQLRQFERYFSRMSEEEAQAAIADFDSAEAIAANIYSLIKEKERQKAQQSRSETDRMRDYDHTASFYTVVDTKPQPDIKSENESETEKKSTSEPAVDAEATAIYETVASRTERRQSHTDDAVASAGDTIKIDRIDTVHAEGDSASADNRRVSTRVDAAELSGSEDGYDAFDETHLDFSSLDELPAQTSPMFWVLLVLTFPLWGMIGLTVLSLFLAAFASLAALIVGLVAVMIGVAAVGTGLSLFGIIYGITQTFSVMPAGVFEIGLGVTIGGAAMFIGISVYNIAIRFLPFVMGKLFVFLKFVMRSTVRLFQKIKKECAIQ